MTATAAVWAGATVLSLGIWIYMLVLRGGFWRAQPRAESASPGERASWPQVVAIVPARDEAEYVGPAIASLLSQDYPGRFDVILVDDRSRDGTAGIAADAAMACRDSDRLHIVAGRERPPGWSGKVWALYQGEAVARERAPHACYYLFADADIEHEPSALRRHVARAEQSRYDLVSSMVRLDTKGFWARLLIPPFVFFFQMLYPFAWVADPTRGTAAAAGGSMLVRKATLQEIGGIAAISGALIDDCTLARAIKDGGGRLWLGLATQTRSLRQYRHLADIWDMVARTAYTQLRRSPLLLAGTVLGMFATFVVSPLAVLSYGVHQSSAALAAGVATWLLQAGAMRPTLSLYRLGPARGLVLPLVALLYTAMTVDSAWRHLRGRGGLWKGRTVSA